MDRWKNGLPAKTSWLISCELFKCIEEILKDYLNIFVNMLIRCLAESYIR